MTTKAEKIAKLKEQVRAINRLKDGLILSRDVEKLHGVSRATVANWTRAGLLIAIEDETLGYVFDPESVRDFVRPGLGRPTSASNAQQDPIEKQES